MPKAIDITGQIFNHWKVLYKTKSSYYMCKCLLCNTLHEVHSYKLRNNMTKCCSKCSAKLREDTVRIKYEGTQIGNWYIDEYIGDSKYKCICKCNNVRILSSYDLSHNIRSQCNECSNKDKSNNMRDHLEGLRFGKLKVIKYLGNYRYECLCDCKNIHITTAYCLKHNISTACEKCASENRSVKYRETMLYKYGDISSQKIDAPREKWQIDILNNESMLKEFIDSMKSNLSRLPTSVELASKLGISVHILLTYIRQYNIELYSGYKSNSELELRELFNKYECIYNNRTLIYPNELDIYIPEKKLAIEFNGTYWHSSIFKDERYHQDKTIACARQGIRLIHIFEYEWNDVNTKDKIIGMLNRIVDEDKLRVIYARNTDIRIVNNEDTKNFLNKYHLQGYSTSSINIGIYYNEELVGIITFGKPRFNTDYQYELIRLAYKNDVSVVGGSSKLFKYFIKNYNPYSILSYCDITKFNGKVYTELGFKTNMDCITKPNYVWVKPSTNEVLPRYKTTKQFLLKNNLGTIEQTEDEIMHNLGYYKIYNAGNLKFTWSNTKES